MTLREAISTVGPVTFDGLLAYCRVRAEAGDTLPTSARKLAAGLRDLQEGGFVVKRNGEWEALPAKAPATLF